MTLPINLNRWLWLGIALLSLIASGVGVLHPSVYDGLIPATIRPGVFTQDLVAIVLSVVLVLLAGSNRSNLVRKRIVAHGILGFLFYAYGIYAMERMYNVLYPLYLMLFGGSLFVLIYSMATGPAMPSPQLMVPRWMRLLGAGYGLLIAVVFNVVWFSELAPLLQSGERIDYFYSIYIIDISFVMPAFAVAAVLTLRRHPVGLMGLPSLFVLGAGILSPLALAESIKPTQYGLARDAGGLVLFGLLTVVSVALTGFWLTTIPQQRPDSGDVLERAQD
jgi:hypothetical protein